MNWPDFAGVAGTLRLACTQQTHCGMQASIFLHTRMTTRAGSLVYVRVESGRYTSKRGYQRTLPIIFSSFWMAVGLKGLTSSMYAKYETSIELLI